MELGDTPFQATSGTLFSLILIKVTTPFGLFLQIQRSPDLQSIKKAKKEISSRDTFTRICKSLIFDINWPQKNLQRPPKSLISLKKIA